ncbi:SDR family oxidoreductase [Saccharomonospora sp. NPDC046836]|uniref:SDR family NAD(P)-dependent oxidoreductase n=1 Tax=Saccharomonospora sp. NPDC046836 TaxID=3156921 RepID=UPI0033E740E8
MKSLRGKVAVVTGGANGIGEAVVRTLASYGTTVVIADKDGPRAAAVAEEVTAEGGTASAIETDVREEAQIVALLRETVERYGRLDILDNNAAALELIPDDPDVTGSQAAVWLDTMRVNALGPLLACKHAIPLMISSGGGSIVNMGSVSGVAGEANMLAYGMSKAAIMHLTRAVAAQWGKSGIRCNAVAPGLVLTPNTAAAMPEKTQEIYVRHSLTPYVGRPQDIANVVAFLASDESRYVSGHIVYADGGISSSLPILADTRDLVTAAERTSQ